MALFLFALIRGLLVDYPTQLISLFVISYFCDVLKLYQKEEEIEKPKEIEAA